MSADPLVVGPGVPLRPVGGESWEVLLADVYVDEVVEIESDPSLVLSGLFLLRLRPLLG